MKYRIWLFGVIIILLFSMGCSKKRIVEPDMEGNIPINIDLSTAYFHGYNVTSIQVTITKGSFSLTQAMTINGQSATGLFTDLAPGVYAINVYLYDGINLIATGQGTGEVIAGQTTVVSITLQYVQGSLEIHISWGITPPYSSMRVLFVGNSHTYFNGGVDYHVGQLINYAHPNWNCTIQACTEGGYTLEQHLADPTTISAIRNGNWDYVVLQEMSTRPMTDPDIFYTSVIKLDSLITEFGGETALYMTWAWGSNPEMYDPVTSAYNYIGAYLDAQVAPCGIAFRNSASANPAINLFSSDNSHASIYGTYLVSCVFLATLWDQSPIGNLYRPEEISPTDALFLQQIAWNTVVAYNLDKKNRALLRGEKVEAQSTYDYDFSRVVNQ